MMPDFDVSGFLISVSASAVTGAIATFVTLRVGLARMEQRLEDNDERVSDGFESFRYVAEGLRDAVNRLNETVAAHAVHVHGVAELSSRLRTVEQEVAVLKARKS